MAAKLMAIGGLRLRNRKHGLGLAKRGKGSKAFSPLNPFTLSFP
jgi:hypothetical protein